MIFKNKFFFLILLLYSLPFFCFGNIIIDKDDFNFNDVIQGDVVSGNLTIKNNSNKTENLSFHSSCECLFLSHDKINLDPYKEVTLFWNFSTEKYRGNVTAVIVISIQDHDNLYFTISGNVKNNYYNPNTIMLIAILFIILVIIFLCILFLIKYRKTKKT